MPTDAGLFVHQSTNATTAIIAPAVARDIRRRAEEYAVTMPNIGAPLSCPGGAAAFLTEFTNFGGAGQGTKAPEAYRKIGL